MKWFTLSVLCCLLAGNMAFPRHFSSNHHDNMMRMMMGDRYDSSHDECSVSFGERHYCGEQTSDENECYRRGCCYDPCPDCSPDIPRCFMAKRMLRDECDVPYEQKDDCGYYGITETECFNRGCCWRPSGLPNDPQCFRGVSVRLVNGEESTTMMRSGRVEVWHDGQWGTICDDNFDWHAARVVCRSFGFQYARPKGYAHFGEGSGNIWMDGLRCHGNEERIQECQHRGWRSHDCSHSEDAGVICSHEEMGNMDNFDNDHQDQDSYRKGDEWNWWNWPHGGRGYGRWDSQRNYHDYNNGYNDNYYDNYDNGRWGGRNWDWENRDFDGWRNGYDNYDNDYMMYNRGWWGNRNNWDWENRDFDGWRNGYDNYDNDYMRYNRGWWGNRGNWDWENMDFDGWRNGYDNYDNDYMMYNRGWWGNRNNWDSENMDYDGWRNGYDNYDNGYYNGNGNWRRNWWRNWDGENRGYGGWNDWGDNDYDREWNRDQWWNWRNWENKDFGGWRDWNDNDRQGWWNWRNWEDRSNGQRRQYDNDYDNNYKFQNNYDYYQGGEGDWPNEGRGFQRGRFDYYDYDNNNNYYRWNWPEWNRGGWRGQYNYYNYDNDRNNFYDNYQGGDMQEGDRSFSRWNGRHGYREKPFEEHMWENWE